MHVCVLVVVPMRVVVSGGVVCFHEYICFCNVCVCLYLCVHIYLCLCLCKSVCMYACVYVHACVCVRTRALCARVCVCVLSAGEQHVVVGLERLLPRKMIPLSLQM